MYRGVRASEETKTETISTKTPGSTLLAKNIHNKMNIYGSNCGMQVQYG